MCWPYNVDGDIAISGMQIFALQILFDRLFYSRIMIQIER